MASTQEVRLDNWFSLFQLRREVDAEIEQKLAEKTDLSLKEFYTLYYLYLHEERAIRLAEIEKYIGLSQSAVSRMITRMENKKKQVIEKYFVSANKKEIYVRITEQGKMCYQSSAQLVDEVLLPVFSGDHLNCLAIKLH